MYALTTTNDWADFLDRYRLRAEELFEREDWGGLDDEWLKLQPATLSDVRITEARIGHSLPQDLTAFYLTTDGWPADDWLNPAINPISQIDCLETQNPSLYRIAAEASTAKWKSRAEDDPQLLEYRDEEGHRVMRCVAITYDTNDQPTVLIDPLADWRLGSWHHDNPAMSWTDGGFSEYMKARYDTLLDEW